MWRIFIETLLMSKLWNEWLQYIGSSIGYFFGSPLRCAVQKWRPFRFRSPSWMTSFRGHPRWRPEAEGPPFCTAHRNGDPKKYPRSWMTSFPASPSWIQDGDGGNDVWRTSRRPWRRPTDVCPIHESCRSLTLLRFKKHLIVSLTQALSKWLSELPAC